MNPKYNIGDKVTRVTNYSVGSLLNPTFETVKEVFTKELKSGEQRYSYLIGHRTEQEKNLTSKEAYIRLLMDKSTALMHKAAELADQLDGEESMQH